MKRFLLMLLTALFLLSFFLPILGYTAARSLLPAADTAVLSGSDPDTDAAADEPISSAPDELPLPSGNSSAPAPFPPSDPPYKGNGTDVDAFRIRDASGGQVLSVPVRDYLIGAVASEMPISWPDEALKAQAVAAHSYVLYCMQHTASSEDAWLTADPARRQGYMTDAVLRSYWGTDYPANLARLSALVDEVLNEVLFYDGQPAGASYFAISNGFTEDSRNVWDSALPYLVSVDSASDRTADRFEVETTLTAAQMRQLLTDSFSLSPENIPPAQWFGQTVWTPAGYVDTIEVCGQPVRGTALRRALSLRSACFFIRCEGDSFVITTRGYGHGVGLSQWGAKVMAEQGADHAAILAHYYPGTVLGLA